MTLKEMNLVNKTDALNVLVVDDERDIREGSERILSRIGFQVMTAPRAGLDGQQAWVA